LSEKLILRTIQKHDEERILLNASQSGFPAVYSKTLQRMSLEDNVTLNFKNYMSTAAVVLNIEKAFDTTRRFGLLHKLSEVEFPHISPSQLLLSSLVKFSMPRKRVVVVHQISGLAPPFYSLFIVVKPAARGPHAALLFISLALALLTG
jgi:hypothetical protein